MEPVEILWGLGGGVVGWVIASVRDVASDLVRRHLLKRAVVSELRQVYDESDRLWQSLARSLQMYSLGALDPALPLPISNRVYTGHYVEALLVCTRVQRTTLELIHKYVDAVTAGIEDLTSRTRHMGDLVARGETSPGDWERYGSMLRALMGNVAEVRWMSGYYLQRPDFPVLDHDGVEVEAYRRNRDFYRAEILNIIASVKGLTLEDFENSAPRPKKLSPDEVT